MKVCALTQGKNVPSARFRVRQYIRKLEKFNIDVDEIPSKYNAYPPMSKVSRPMWGIKTISNRSIDVIKSRRYDITWIQKPFVSKYVTLEKFTNKARLLDVDDAIWTTNYSLVKKLGSNVDCIICGNNFIANEYEKYNKNIEIVPTGVDIKKFKPIDKCFTDEIIIGWSGSSSGLKYVYSIEKYLNYIVLKHKNVKIRIVSDRQPRFNFIQPDKVEYIKWSPENEVSTIQSMDIGIMPLNDTIFERGKCSYKMLLYMSCSIPVVVSPVGMNEDVFNLGEIGYMAKSEEEWISSIENLIIDIDKRRNMGRKGRIVVEENYSNDIIVNKLKDIFYKYK